MRTIRLAFAFAAFLLALTASLPARADVTITGTVGEIGIMPPSGRHSIIHFKYTDPNQTKTCNGQGGAAYAWFYGAINNATYDVNDPGYRELYAALLVSKKGAPLSCTINDAVTCHVTSCTLP